jgi:serine/threonine protein kinase/serine phosphatase RsbU (regulator of sigma subunit)
MNQQAESSDRLEELLTAALEKPAEERSAFIASVSGDDSSLAGELRDLLSSYNKATGYFDDLARNLGLPGAPTPTSSHMSNDPSAMIGRDVAQYRIVEYIGGGGMGMVYKAEDQRLQRFAALKFLPASVGHDPESKERFLREARAASALDHPGICTVFEIGEESGQSYIAMAFYEGRTVEKLIERGPVEIDTAVDLGIQIGEGLSAAHAKGIVHRDMKPANVMVTGDGKAKILDFGLAKSDDMGLVTQPGAILGTAAYMSPEQATGGSVDHRTDVWSLGVILYEMLAGQRAFPGAYPQAIVYAILNMDPEPITGIRPGLPLQLVQVIERSLAKEPDRRYSRVDEFVEALKAVRDRQSARSEARQFVSDAPATPAAAPLLAVDDEDEVLTILCVDDEPELELLMQQRFRKKIRAGDWKFVFAMDGQEALNQLERHPEVGLILTDLNMPRMDGLTLLGKLADLDRPLRTMVVSAYGDLEKIRTAMNRGAFDFVTKPIDFQDLETTVVKAAQDLESYRKALRAAQQAVSIQQEVDVARRIQDAIMPASFPSTDALDVYGFSAPASDMSGTFFDAFKLADGRVGLLMGDAGSRGVTAALLMAMGQTFVKSFLQKGESPDACLNELNAMLFADGLPNVELRLVAGVLDTASGALTVANAGHAAPFLIRAGGSLDIVEVEGDAVWKDRNARYSSATTTLGSGDALVLPSRGLTETTNDAGNAYSRERLASTLRDAPDMRPTSLIRHVIRSVQEFAGDNDPREDLTILAARRT